MFPRVPLQALSRDRSTCANAINLENRQILNSNEPRQSVSVMLGIYSPGSKVHGVNTGPIWADRTHVGPIWAPCYLGEYTAETFRFIYYKCQQTRMPSKTLRGKIANIFSWIENC